MKVCHTLICFFFLTSLQDGDTGEPRTAKEGTNITVSCSFSYSGSRRFFCKETCEGNNILIETTEDRDQRGRYSIQYEKKSIFSSDIMNVSITGLKQSDSGRYRCQLNNTWTATKYEDFDLDVTGASTTSEPKCTLQTFTSTTTKTTLTQRLSSSSSSSPSESTQQTRTSTGPKSLVLYVGLILAILIFMFVATLLIFLKNKKFGQKKVCPVKTQSADVTVANPLYEEIREEDRENKPPPGEISSIYVCAKSCTTDTTQSTTIYSLPSVSQIKAEDDGVEYSEVHYFNDTTSSSGAPCGCADNVTYSEPQIAKSSASHSSESPPLYSSITLQQ
ncbi:uncharacterized protein LOC124883058 [Girardinichthys multiradiatus]|uniref:uncharacterized protein LOC124883058 n=1 Tax=Girardinichthys multiradiatus TaxID=208333 RepID=UPI001FAD7482|nr:uncharacterized protein LOC124883058 [Girardinichthys multiradiatus]